MAVVERWPLYRVDRCREVTVVERLPLVKVRLYRAFSLTWPASMQIYWNKRKCLHKKRVQLPQDLFGTPTWPPFQGFGTPILPPWRHMKTLYRTLSTEWQKEQRTETRAAHAVLRTLSNDWFYEQNNCSARASHFLVRFFDVHCKTTTWNLPMRRFVEGVDILRQIFPSLFEHA